MAVVSSIINSAMGAIVGRRTNINVGQSTKIRWRALLSTRGGTICIGKQSILNCRIAFDSPEGRIDIGDRCYIGASLLVCHTSISIGCDAIISWGVTIVDHDSHALNWDQRSSDVIDWHDNRKTWDHVKIRPVHIEEKVWIGFGVSILKGVRVGAFSVIAAGSVVTKDVPPYSLVAGNPARVMRSLNTESEAQHGG
jgi:acetyltransferase-like isoleucine patch superfamily enzyme